MKYSQKAETLPSFSIVSISLGKSIFRGKQDNEN